MKNEMKNKIIKRSLITLGIGVLIGVAIILYFKFAPHRDAQSSPIDFNLSATELVNESLKDSDAANNKYLSEDGDSKIMAITGKVASMDTDFEENQVLLLKADDAEAGVQCTFMKSTNKHVKNIKIGDIITIKGVYKIGATFDEDFEEYQDVIVEESDLLTGK